MTRANPLPSALVRRYHDWRDTGLAANADRFRRLAEEGQSPDALIVSCCDSRVTVGSIFGEGPGEFFVHRNIANLVPPYAPDGRQHGTSAVVEFAVTALKVPRIVVMGHARCGGIAGCHDMCAGDAPALEAEDSFVGRWMDVLRPAYADVVGIEDRADRLEAFEKRGVLASLENLRTFPYVAEAQDAGRLTLHGCWFDISTGALEAYDPEAGAFVAV